MRSPLPGACDPAAGAHTRGPAPVYTFSFLLNSSPSLMSPPAGVRKPTNTGSAAGAQLGTTRTPDAGARAWEVIQVDTVCPGRRLEPLNCRTLIQPSCRRGVG